MRRVKRLPNRVPVGTKYVIEGCGGRVTARFIEFPDGRRVDLMGTVNQTQLSGIDRRPDTRITAPAFVYAKIHPGL